MAMTKELRDRLLELLNGFGKFRQKLGVIDVSLAAELKGLIDEVRKLLRGWRDDAPQTQQSAQGVSETKYNQALMGLQLSQKAYLDSVHNTLVLLHNQQLGSSKILCVEREKLAKIEEWLKMAQYQRFEVKDLVRWVYKEIESWRNAPFMNRVRLLPVRADQGALDVQLHSDRRIFEMTLLTLLKFLHVHSPHERRIRLFLKIKEDKLVVGGLTAREIEMSKRRVGFFDLDKSVLEQECGYALLLRLALIYDPLGLRTSKIQEEKNTAQSSVLYFTIKL